MSYLKIIMLLGILLGSQITAANNQLGLWYTGANPDYKPFQTEHGLALTFESELSQDFFARLYFNETDFMASGPNVGFEAIESWTEVGVGLTHNALLKGLYSYVTYSDIQSEMNEYDGFGYHLGYRVHWNKQWSSMLQVGHIDTGFSDIQLIGKLYYQLNDSTSIGAAIKDHHNWDMTSYEVGVLYTF